MQPDHITSLLAVLQRLPNPYRTELSSVSLPRRSSPSIWLQPPFPDVYPSSSVFHFTPSYMELPVSPQRGYVVYSLCTSLCLELSSLLYLTLHHFSQHSLGDSSFWSKILPLGSHSNLCICLHYHLSGFTESFCSCKM